MSTNAFCLHQYQSVTEPGRSSCSTTLALKADYALRRPTVASAPTGMTRRPPRTPPPPPRRRHVPPWKGQKWISSQKKLKKFGVEGVDRSWGCGSWRGIALWKIFLGHGADGVKRRYRSRGYGRHGSLAALMASTLVPVCVPEKIYVNVHVCMYKLSRFIYWSLVLQTDQTFRQTQMCTKTWTRWSV